MTDWRRYLLGTHALIDLDAFARNIAVLRSYTPRTAFMAILKADAYGHGSVACARAAAACGCEWLGVARIGEALLLRREGIEAPILVLGPPNVGEIEHALRQNITLAVGSRHALEAVVDASVRVGTEAQVHVKVDTGMRRYGFTVEDTRAVVGELSRLPNVRVDGVFTHFARADEVDLRPTDGQVRAFSGVVEQLRQHGLLPTWVHEANSAGILTGRTFGTNLVRGGIAMYGLSPSGDLRLDERFTPILSMRSVIGRRFTLHAGEGVAYGWSYVAERDEEVAVVPVGYADGLPRQLANAGWFLVNGERAPIRGRVCMDQTIIGVPEQAREGDVVMVYGGPSGMALDHIGELSGTNNYEIATRVTARVPRVYLREGQPVAWEHLLLGERGTCDGHENGAEATLDAVLNHRSS